MPLSSFSLEPICKPLGNVLIFDTTINNLIPLAVEYAAFVDLALNLLVLYFPYHFLGDFLF